MDGLTAFLKAQANNLPSEDISSETLERIKATFRFASGTPPNFREEVGRGLSFGRLLSTVGGSLRTPVDYRDQFRQAAMAAKRLAQLDEGVLTSLEFFSSWSERISLRNKMRDIARAAEQLVDSVVVPRSGRRSSGEAPRAKEISVLVAARIACAVLSLRGDERPKLVLGQLGVENFKLLAEIIFEVLTGDPSDQTSRLDHQIQQYRRGRLNLAQGHFLALDFAVKPL